MIKRFYITREHDQKWYHWLLPWHAHYGEGPAGIVVYWLVWGFWFDLTEADE
jgi:hypothetical protein